MADDIPEWATREACKRLGEKYDAFVKARLSVFVGRAIRVCAQLIAEHEEPPVDPAVEAIETALAGFYAVAQRGEWPGSVVIRRAIMEELAEQGLRIVREQS